MSAMGLLADLPAALEQALRPLVESNEELRLQVRRLQQDRAQDAQDIARLQREVGSLRAQLTRAEAARTEPAPTSALAAANLMGLRSLAVIVASLVQETPSVHANPRLPGLLDDLVATTFLGPTEDDYDEDDCEGDEGDEGDDEGDFEGDYASDEGDFEGDEGDEGEDVSPRPKPDLGRTSRALNQISSASMPKECPFGHRARQNTSGGNRWCWSCDRLIVRGLVLLRCFDEECAGDRDYCFECCQADSGSE
jgi:hypothetical protein